MLSIISRALISRNPHLLRSRASPVLPHSPRTVSRDLTSGHLTLFRLSAPVAEHAVSRRGGYTFFAPTHPQGVLPVYGIFV